MLKSNLAYNELNLNLEKKQFQTTKKPNIKQIKPKSIAKIKPRFYIFLIATTSVVLSLYLTYFVQSNELSFEINAAKKQYNIQKSETIRLQSLLAIKCSNAVEIEEYAKLKLGMRKQNSRLVHYIKRSEADFNNLKKQKELNNVENKNFLNKLKSCFNVFN